MSATRAKKALRERATPQRAAVMRGYFKIGPGEYGEGDEFIGVTLPDLRRVAREQRDLALDEVGLLLDSPIHEDRLLAVIILAERAKKADAKERERVYRFYMKKRRRINNWDLIDTSAPHVVGPLLDGPAREAVDRLSRSARLWDRRIAILAHQYEIKRGRIGPFLRFAPRFLGDEEDLIHKAVGWMLRECGDQDRAALEAFLEKYAARMPRTMLRYAIEKFTPTRRAALLEKGRSRAP